MVFSETAQPSFSYYAPVAVRSLSQWTTFTRNINWALNWSGLKNSLSQGNTYLKISKKINKIHCTF